MKSVMNISCLKDMSVDQSIFYRACRAVIDGVCPPDLAKHKLGKVHHARWLTLAIRILFLYMSTASPSEDLCCMAWFTVNVYGYLWFTAKHRWRVTEAAPIVLEAMKHVKALKETNVEEYRVVYPVFERGFLYWCHPEQLILGCLASENAAVRFLSVFSMLT